MNKKILFILLIFISNCSINKVVNHHGVHFLEKKQEKLILNSTNKNDILSNLGPPSTESTFDNDVWIYIERKETKTSIIFRICAGTFFSNRKFFCRASLLSVAE